MVDDGNSSRSNRNNLFSDTLTNIGLIFNESKDKLTIVYFSEEFPTSILEKLSPEAEQMEEYVEVQDCRAGVTNRKSEKVHKSRTKKKDKKSKTLGVLAQKVSEIMNEVGERLSKIDIQSSDEKEESVERAHHHHHHHHHDDTDKDSKKHSQRSKSKKKSRKHHKHHTHHKDEHGKKHVHHTHEDEDNHEISRSNSFDKPVQTRHRPSEFVHNHGGDSDEGDVVFPEDSFESDSSSKQGMQPLELYFCYLLRGYLFIYL